jgi:anti-anti-sigma regulatory factor
MQQTRILPAELTIYTVGELQPQWLAWLGTDAAADAAGKDAGDDFAVDAAAVAEVDGAGVQLLVALSHSLGRQQRRLALVAPSEALATACARLGVPSLVAAAACEGRS